MFGFRMAFASEKPCDSERVHGIGGHDEFVHRGLQVAKDQEKSELLGAWEA